MRKTATVTITDAGRDKGKTFALTEMSATDAEDWAIQAFLALARSGVEIPEDVESAGLAGLAEFGLKGLAGINYAEAKPLLDQLMGCVQIKPDPKNPSVVRALIEDDIEEWRTRFKLRAEAFKLHVGFSQPGGPSTSIQGTPAGSESAPAAMFPPRSRRS